MAEKKDSGFTVSDRRKFTPEGELRPDAQDTVQEVKQETPQQPSSAPAAATPRPAADSAAAGESAERQEVPEPPSAEQQQAQQHSYNEAGRKLDEMLQQAGMPKPDDLEMTFEKLVVSMYMTAMMQLGMLRQEGEQPRTDLLGARQTIDSLSILSEKTKGNLSTAEQHLLQNVLFELRMATVEITNAIARGPQGKGPGGVPGGPIR